MFSENKSFPAAADRCLSEVENIGFERSAAQPSSATNKKPQLKTLSWGLLLQTG